MDMTSPTARIGIVLIMISMLGSLIVFIPEEAEVEAVGSPAISISITQPKAIAHVAPGQDGIVSFSGTVTAQIPWSPSIQFCVVSLIAEAGGWPVSTPPPLIFSKQVKTSDFKLTVQVPPTTSHMTQGQLSVSARWSYSPGAIGGTVTPTSAIIVVEQYYQFSVACENPFLEIQPGSATGFQLKLINEGNAADKLRIEILNQNDLSDAEWTVQLSQNRFEVPEKSERQLTLTLTTPKKWHIWMNKITTINLKVVSSQAETLGQPSDVAEYSLYVRQRGVGIPGFEPTFAIMALALLGAVGYRIHRKRGMF
ncbi:MAG: choice-of-anchor T family protein [Thermoplasmatota archaeon]